MKQMDEKDNIALLFDRAYIDTQPCYFELATQLANSGFHVDLYMIFKSNNHLPFFENQGIRVLPFPDSVFQKAEYWSKIIYAKDRKYKAIIGTPVRGAWVAYKTAKIQRIPYYYFADELIEQLVMGNSPRNQKKMEQRNYLANKHAIASISLGEERYNIQKTLNKIEYPHDKIIIPNAQAGPAKKLKSNFFRDYFNIEDRKPILLYAGTLDWNLAKRLYEETKNYGERDYHLVFHARTLGLMGEKNHPFIKISNVPLPGSILNYAISSADMGLALYDKNSIGELRNAFTGGKIGTYLKNELPIITGNAENLRFYEERKVGVYWDGETSFDEIALKGIRNMESNRKNIPAFYRENLQYEIFFEGFKAHLRRSIK
jgi:hypothetical protein